MVFPRVARQYSAKEKLARTNKKIRTEAKLLNTFHEYLTLRAKKNVVALREFDCSNGIADLVLAELAKGWIRHRQIGLIQPRWLYALKQMPYRRSFTVSTFSGLAGVTRRRALAALAEFASAGFC